MFYSPENSGFYDKSIHGEKIPADAVEISRDYHRDLMDGQSKGKQIRADENGYPILVEPPLSSIIDRRSKAKRDIDTAAGKARRRFVSVGQLVEEEYHLALSQSQEWRSAGSPADDVPKAVQDWADAANLTADEAAADIEHTAAIWQAVLLQIRNIRLMGKAAIDAADDQQTPDDMATVAQQYIDQLNALAP